MTSDSPYLFFKSGSALEGIAKEDVKCSETCFFHTLPSVTSSREKDICFSSSLVAWELTLFVMSIVSPSGNTWPIMYTTLNPTNTQSNLQLTILCGCLSYF